MNLDRTSEVYHKLKPFLAMFTPGGDLKHGWRRPRFTSELRAGSVKWMPDIRDGWRRLYFKEFMDLYSIKY